MSRKPCARQLQVWNTGRCSPEAEKCGKNQVLNNPVLRIGDCNPQCGKRGAAKYTSPNNPTGKKAISLSSHKTQRTRTF